LKILLAIDLTARSDRALARGFLLARELSGELRVVHVVDRNLPDELRAHTVDWARRTLARETEPLSAASGVEPSLKVIIGDPKGEIVRLADPLETDLVVLGVHGATDGKRFADSTAGRIVKSGSAATLLVREPAEGPYRVAVVGVDFSLYARLAVRQACAVAPAAQLVLCHAFHLPFKGLVGVGDLAATRGYEQRLAFDRFLAEEMANLERHAACYALPDKLRTVLQPGEPRQVLRDLCRREGADLVVIGTHGRVGASRALWGSVASDLLEDPPCDVLVIKPF
jgi:nucleotide-binding universal stress UspA family protein